MGLHGSEKNIGSPRDLGIANLFFIVDCPVVPVHILWIMYLFSAGSKLWTSAARTEFFLKSRGGGGAATGDRWACDEGDGGRGFGDRGVDSTNPPLLASFPGFSSAGRIGRLISSLSLWEDASLSKDCEFPMINPLWGSILLQLILYRVIELGRKRVHNSVIIDLIWFDLDTRIKSNQVNLDPNQNQINYNQL